MGDESVEQSWYAFWLIKAIVSLSFFGVVTLICIWVLQRVRSKRATRRTVTNSIVHLLGALRSFRNFDLRPGERKRRSG
jgi:hypothetical protein